MVGIQNYTCMVRRRNKGWVIEGGSGRYGFQKDVEMPKMLAEHPNSNNVQWGLRTKRSLPKKVSNVGETYMYLLSARPNTISNDTAPDNYIGLLSTWKIMLGRSS